MSHFDLYPHLVAALIPGADQVVDEDTAPLGVAALVVRADDSAWLDVALEVHAHVGGPGRAALASIINDFVRHDPLAGPTATERARITDAVGNAPIEADLGDGPELTVEDRGDILRSLVTTALALQQGYARL